MEAETRFRAMGSDVHVVTVGGAVTLLEMARERIEHLEGLWSRFRSTSEISRLNVRAGRPVLVSPETIGLIRRAVDGARVTGGRYDPTVLGALIRAGYDHTFELLDEDSPRLDSDLLPGAEAIEIDEEHSTVRLPRGVGFDPGGIGKGYAADLVVAELLAAGASGACANVGGDLRVGGEAPGGGAWAIGLEHPLRPRATEVVGLASGAVATTTTAKRVWGPPGDRRHHVIDPSTGEPADTGVLSSTVIAAEGWQAEVMAKAALVAGVADGLALLAETATDGLLIAENGTVYPSFGLVRYLRDTSAPLSRPA